MPSDDADLETEYSEQDYLDVNEADNIRVAQTATGEYAIHQFKDYITADSVELNWEGQSDLAPSQSTVYLQIYNRETSEWEMVVANTGEDANTDFVLNGIVLDLSDYKDGNSVISCRVYQLSV